MRLKLPPGQTAEPARPPDGRGADLGSLYRRLHLLGRTPGSAYSGEWDYLMAFFSQVAYLPTKHEARNPRRTKVVPSSLFDLLARSGAAPDVKAMIDAAFPDDRETAVEVVATANSVTIAVRIANVVIIASRGTVLFHSLLNPPWDLLIDVNALPVSFLREEDRYHFGFLEEACASLPHIRAAYEKIGSGRPIFFTGHSLGGALSAVMDRLWEVTWPTDDRAAIVFGCPRFGNRKVVTARSLRSIVRKGDPVPKVPLVRMGYSDPDQIVSVSGPDRRSRFRLYRNHSMERYRRAIAEREGLLDLDAAHFQAFRLALCS